MAKPELGTKRIDPDTGRKFYDLNRDPIVSPYTGKSYPRSYFDTELKREDEDLDDEVLDDEEELADEAELVTLEDADEDEIAKKTPGSPVIDDVTDDEGIELGDADDDDTFLADDEEEEDDDVSVIIKVGKDEDEI